MLKRMLLLGGGMLLICTAAVPAGAAAAAVLPNTFRFTGTCTDCYRGQGDGTATLVLTATYQLGQEITADKFVSFTYDGTDLMAAFTVTDASQVSLAGAMTGPFPDTERFSFFGPNSLAFMSAKDGGWCVGFSCTADYGSSHRWAQLAAQSDVPEPGTWAMVTLGFGVAGASLRRAKTRMRITYA